MPDNYVVNQTEKGKVCIAEDAICTIVSAAVAEVAGVAGFSNALGADIADFLGIKSTSKGAPKGVKVSSQDSVVTIDVLVMVRYGHSIAEVAGKTQKAVAGAVEAMTGMKTVVNVHVTGISFEKAEKK